MIQENIATKDKLSILSPKEQSLKEQIFNIIIKSKASNKTIIRVLAYLINTLKH